MARPKHLLLIVGTAWLFDAMDVALLSFIMPMLKTEWQLSVTQLGLVGSITSLGMILGAVISGRLADTYGRKHVLMGTLVLFSLSNFALIFTPDINWFMAVRFLTGVGLGGELPVAATMLADNYSGVKRAQMLILGDSFWAYGWIVASLIAYLIMPVFGWRAGAAVTLVTALYAFILREHLPKEKPQPRVKKAPFASLFSREYRRSFLMLSVMWFIVMLTYYGIFLWLPSVLTMRGFSIVNSLGFTVIMSIAQLPGYYLAVYLIKRISGKLVLGIYIVGTIIAALTFGTANNIPMILISGMLLSFFDLGAWGTLIALTPTQFPQEIRGTATGSAQSVGRVGAAIGPFLVGWLLDAHLGIHAVFAIFVGLLLIALVVLIFGVKDNSQTEEEAAMHVSKL